MSYLKLLEEARALLERGELLAAEDHLQRARRAWEGSRFRAPLVERGLEPALRRASRWFGRDSSSPVLPVFGHLAENLQEDLAALGNLLREEALDLADRPDESRSQQDVQILERALRLDRQSEIFSLARAERWRVVRGYLQASRRFALPIRAELLGDGIAAEQDVAWFSQWAQAWLSSGVAADRETLQWLRRQAAALARVTREHDDTPAAAWWWIAARAALRDPQAGPESLDATVRALEEGLGGEARHTAMRTLAGLLVNERVHAVTGADPEQALSRFAALAAGDPEASEAPTAPEAVWPPPEILSLVQSRRPARREGSANRAQLVCVAAAVDSNDLVLVSHEADQALDVLTVHLDAEARSDDPFAATAPEARGWIRRWLPERAVLVCEGGLERELSPLLADLPLLRLDELERRLGVDTPAAEGASKVGAAHPLFDPTVIVERWTPLVARARALTTRLAAVVEDAPLLSESWGRDNLRVLDEHGLSICGALLRAAEALVEEPEVDPASRLQVVRAEVDLAWPRLERRPWPTGRARLGRAVDPAVEPESGRDLWLVGRADPVDLVQHTRRARRAELITVGAERAERIAALAATAVDATTVSVAPARSHCAQPWIDLLASWIRQSVSAPQRQADVVWLLAELVRTPTGAPSLSEAEFLDPPARQAVRDAANGDHRCGAECSLSEQDGCWPAQLAGRNERARLWIVDLEVTRDGLDHPETVVLDDPVSWCRRARTEEAESRLEHGAARARHAQRAWLWLEESALDQQWIQEWRMRAKTHRPLQRLAGESASLSPPTVAAAAPRLWLVPPGYRSNDPVVGAWGLRLVERRVELLRDVQAEGPTATVTWLEIPESPVAAGGSSVALTPHVPWQDERVAAPLLGPVGDVSDLLLLSRGVDLARSASEDAICLDPRLSALLAHDGGLVEGERGAPEQVPWARALESGARLLSDRQAQPGADWAAPLTPARLLHVGRTVDGIEEIDPKRAETLSRALRDTRRGQSILLAGASDTERTLVVETVRALADATLDGGPLGIRCIVVIGAKSTALATDSRARRFAGDGDETRGAVVLEIERGRVSRLDVSVGSLLDDEILPWARRVSSLAWVCMHADRDLHGDRLDPFDRAPRQLDGAAGRLADVVDRSGAAVLAFVDEAGAAAEALTRVLDARTAAVFRRARPANEIVAVPWIAGPLEIACPHCEASIVVETAWERCPACDRRCAATAVGQGRIFAALELVMIERLRERDPEGAWWALGFDDAWAVRLREVLDLQPYSESEAPLLAAGSVEDQARTAVFAARELWEQTRCEARSLLLMPATPAERIESLLARLESLRDSATSSATMEPVTAELWLSPVGIAPAPPAFGRLRWTVARTEAEFRLRDVVRRVARRRPRAGLSPARGPWASFEDPATRVDGLLDGPLPIADADAWCGRLFDAVENAGLLFDRQQAVWGDAHRLLPFRWLLEWARTEGLLEFDAAEDTQMSAGRSDTVWESVLREAAQDGEQSLGTLLDRRSVRLATPAAALRRSSGEGPNLDPSSIDRAIAGSGRTRALAERAARAVDRGQRALVVVPGAMSRLEWSTAPASMSPGFEVCTAEEVALAFLDDLHDGAGSQVPRLLPDTTRADGEDLRLRLMRETSRRYAEQTGTVPPIDASQLQRVVEGERLDMTALSRTDPPLDGSLLHRCAKESREAGGWLTLAELREGCSLRLHEDPRLAQEWGARYPFVAIDDAHEMHPDLLAFVRALFSRCVQWISCDPLIADIDDEIDLPGDGTAAVGPPTSAATRSDSEEIRLTSERMPRAWMSAIETLWRDAPALPGRPRTQRKGRGTGQVESVRVLTLQAALDWILSEIPNERIEDRVAIVMAHEQDRAWFVQGLRSGGHRVRLPQSDARWAASGPRQLIAALALLVDSASAKSPHRPELPAVALGSRAESGTSTSTDLIADFDSDRAVSRASDERRARVRVLRDLRASIDGATSVSRAIERLARAGVLDPILTLDTAVGRIKDLLESWGERPVSELLEGVDLGMLVEPQGRSCALWVLAPDELVGSPYDHVVHVCTGFESATRHYRALARASERFTALYSEHDPLR